MKPNYLLQNASRHSLLQGLLVLACLLVVWPVSAEKKDHPPVGPKKAGPGGPVGPAGPARLSIADSVANLFDEFFSPDPGGPGYDETTVLLNVQRIGATELPAVIKGKTAYLPISDLFQFLKIKNQVAPGFDSVTGFFVSPEAPFCVDNVRYQIRYQGKTIQLEPSDLIQTETNLYLRLDYFQLFGLSSSFEFTNLSVKMSASVDLPAIRELQLAQLHRNLSRLKGEVTADTFIKRNYPRFNLGFADWTVTETHQSDGLNDLRAGLAVGAVVAGGEANLVLNYNGVGGFDQRQQFFQWRYADNDREWMRQLSVGRIYTRSTASIVDPVIGVQITNAPTTYRKSAGTYRLSRFTQPGWTVELYVNNVLVDFTKADASGFFSFDVPLVYGTSSIRLRYYGPYGEERNWEDNITMPFNFLPKKEWEYTATAGMVEDSLHSRYGRASLSYGLTQFLTLSTGNEYLSSVRSGANMPFASLSMRMFSRLMLVADYTHTVKASALLNYRLPGNGELELSWTKYDPNQRALLFNFLEERKLGFSMPFSTRSFSGMARLSVSQAVITQYTDYDRAELLLSTAFRRFSANVSTYLVSTGQQDPPRFDPYVYSNVSLAYRVGKGLTLMPQAQYSFKDQRFLSVKCELEKYFVNRGYFNLNFEQNLLNGVCGMSVGMRYDLSVARVAAAARRYNNIDAYTVAASGSILFDPKTHYAGFRNRSSAGRGGITIAPFLDINGNGARDENEPRVSGLRVTINSGHVEYSARDTVVRIFDLEPYTNYLVDISQNNFENITWQVRKKTMSVAVSANQLRLVEVPVKVMTEASGTVYLRDSLGRRGIGRIKVDFFRADGSLVTTMLSDRDGYFSTMELTPGDYLIKVDEQQLKRIGMKGLEPIHLHVPITREGSFLDGLKLEIERR